MRFETADETAAHVQQPRALIQVIDVVKHFQTGTGPFQRQTIRAVDGVTFDVYEGETLGLVGESGCGKSTLGRVIVRLHPATAGRVLMDGVDLLALRGKSLRRMRKDVQMVFQDPFASLNPRMTVGQNIAEPLTNFHIGNGKRRVALVQDIMGICGLNSNFTERYPHEFSGGQRQRIGIARALVLNPRFVVLDEPISALDVSIQAQIVNLLESLQRQFRLTYLFIAHDLSVIRHLSNRVAVMYLGKIVEIGNAKDIYSGSLHPYTKALHSSIPVPDPDHESSRKPILLHGEIPSPARPPKGCRFHTRCPIARFPICSEDEPILEDKTGSGHLAACHFAGKL